MTDAATPVPNGPAPQRRDVYNPTDMKKRRRPEPSGQRSTAAHHPRPVPELAETASREQRSYLGFLAEPLMSECDDRARRCSGTARWGGPNVTITVDVTIRAIPAAAVLFPGGTPAVDAALLFAETAVPHPARPTRPDALRFAHTRLLPRERPMSLDKRLEGAAARPVAVPETTVVDRGKVFVSGAFTAACETLGISVQSAPPFAPTAKGIVERTFGSINTLFCRHLPGYTGSDAGRRGGNVEREACFSVARSQDLLDEWLVHPHHRPHEGLRHPVMPRVALTPNQMWAALDAACGYVPVPLSGGDYLELLPVRWQAPGERGDPHRPPHLRPPGPGPVPGAALRHRRPRRERGGPPQPPRRPPDLGPVAGRGAGGDPVDPP
ncbi:hypothetical protein [Embleya sp. NPDC050493]|uniref:hypothetical protein n=1 Tax=Embleya sp. NPDC050493 TaxID=3363989 RepID=UPI003792A114